MTASDDFSKPTPHPDNIVPEHPDNVRGGQPDNGAAVQDGAA